MHILAIIVVLVLLYLWLAGHWFGRVIAFLSWGAALTLIAALFADGHIERGLPLVIGAWFGAWFIAKAPQAYWTRRHVKYQQTLEAQQQQIQDYYYNTPPLIPRDPK